MPSQYVEQPSEGTRVHSHLLVAWGIVSDIDFQSEEHRWMGATRFTYVAVQKVISKQEYPCRIHFLPARPLAQGQGQSVAAAAAAAGGGVAIEAATPAPVMAEARPDRDRCLSAFCRGCGPTYARPADQLPQPFTLSPVAAAALAAASPSDDQEAYTTFD